MLYSQGEKDTVDLYIQSFKSHWDMCLAFGVSPGIHKGLVNNMLTTADWMVDHANVTADERTRAVRETTELVKAAMVISGADKRQYGQL